MAVITYNQGRTDLLDGTIDLLTNTLKIMLVTSSYIADKDDQFVEEGVDDANEHELTGTGYAPGFAGAGRKTLSAKAVTKDDANDRAEFDDTADITWTGIDAGTAAAAILYFHNTADTDSVLIMYNDSGGFPIVTNGGDLTIQWNAEGILQLA